jgi:hypothetical protein
MTRSKNDRVGRYASVKRLTFSRSTRQTRNVSKPMVGSSMSSDSVQRQKNSVPCLRSLALTKHQGFRRQAGAERHRAADRPGRSVLSKESLENEQHGRR